jgi:hypothetical protein
MNKHLIVEIVKQLDCLNTGMWVSILPDEIIDLHPTDEDIIESAECLIMTIDLDGRKLESRSPFTVGGVWHNFALLVHDKMKHALSGVTTEIKVKLVLEYGQMLETVAMHLLGDRYDEFLFNRD